MRVYHGSTLAIPHPDTAHSKRFLDFGPGFYVTTFRRQAERWARRKCDRLRAAEGPILNVYELDEDFSGFEILRFDGVEGNGWTSSVTASTGRMPIPGSTPSSGAWPTMTCSGPSKAGGRGISPGNGRLNCSGLLDRTTR